MSGIRTSDPVALVRGGNGLSMDTFKSELDCVLTLLNNGSLGNAFGGIGWGGESHKKALAQVEEALVGIQAAIQEQDEREARLSTPMTLAEADADMDADSYEIDGQSD